MNSYEVQNLMNLSGFEENSDFFGVDVSEFSARGQWAEECVQTSFGARCGKLFDSLARPAGRPRVRPDGRRP